MDKRTDTTTDTTTTTTTDGVPIRRVPMGHSGRENDPRPMEWEDSNPRMDDPRWMAEMGFVEEARNRVNPRRERRSMDD